MISTVGEFSMGLATPKKNTKKKKKTQRKETKKEKKTETRETSRASTIVESMVERRKIRINVLILRNGLLRRPFSREEPKVPFHRLVVYFYTKTHFTTREASPFFPLSSSSSFASSSSSKWSHESCYGETFLARTSPKELSSLRLYRAVRPSSIIESALFVAIN